MDGLAAQMFVATPRDQSPAGATVNIKRGQRYEVMMSYYGR